MDAPLNDVEFLAASENRVRVLTYLRDAAADRREIHEETDISRSTLSRCISGLEDRGWIRQSGSECEITPLGRFFIDEFVNLLEMAEAVQNLRDLETMPVIDEMDVDPRRLCDANVELVSHDDPTAPMRRAKQLVRNASRVSLATERVEGLMLGVLWDRTVHGDLTVVAVVTDEVVATIRDNAEMARMAREMVDTERAEFLRFAGSVPHIVALVDDTWGCLLVRDDEGVVRGELDTDDAAFRSWVAATIESYRAAATPVAADVFTP